MTLSQRVCATVLHAVAPTLKAATSHTTGTDPSYIECRVIAPPTTLDATAEGVPQAYYHYNTVLAHQVQTYATPGGIRDRGELPQEVPHLGVEAAWIPSEGRLIATNGTLTAGGSFIDVTVTRGPSPAPDAEAQKLAREAAAALLAVAPRGPGQPGPS